MSNKQLILMELCPKGDLHDCFNKNMKEIMENKDLIKYLFTQICQSVFALHNTTGYAHLDLKLDNILIGQDSKLKLCDLGLA